MLKFVMPAVLAMLLASGAASAQAGAPPAPEALDASIWQGEVDRGSLVHRPTKVALPDDLLGFKRHRVRTLSADDVIAHYRLVEDGTPTELTVYMFKPGQLPEHRLKGSLESFATLAPTAFVWSAGPFDIVQAVPLHGYKGTFKTGIGPDTRMDYLYFFDLGQWRVKVRATLTKVREVEQERRLDSAVRGLPWAQILSANAACTGKACTRPAFEPISNNVMETAVGAMLGKAMKFDPGKERKLPVVLKAQASLLGEIEVRQSEGEDPLYVTEVKRLATYRLVRLPDPAGDLLTKAFGTISVDRPVYGLMIDIGKAGLMPRLFLGKPTPQAFAEAVGELVIDSYVPMVSVKTAASRIRD